MKPRPRRKFTRYAEPVIISEQSQKLASALAEKLAIDPSTLIESCITLMSLTFGAVPCPDAPNAPQPPQPPQDFARSKTHIGNSPTLAKLTSPASPYGSASRNKTLTALRLLLGIQNAPPQPKQPALFGKPSTHTPRRFPTR